ncbi:synaptonemal complex protein 2 [Sander lucioperca]|uniref:synaptonemal complex protein 2 n=1 Tax=Sander lucioperca TaxID=283035 RepID=UPI0016539A2A|nr:synaptonemal complex protein 2 [Sander lucioperca]
MDQNQTPILSQVAAAVLTVGDYELQVSLSEALCRLTPRKEREHRANQWFSCRDISRAFCDIRDVDFEVDCRRFLNFVNRYHGDQRRAFLDSTELFRPKDEKLDEFWIDFNVSSGCVSFFVDEPQGFLWGSIHLLKEEVDRYSLYLKQDGCTGAETVLSVQLNTPIMHQNSRGRTVELNFDPEHHRDLEEAAGRVFMKVKSSSPLKAPGGTVQVSPSAERPNGRCYGRKKPQSKSHLKILPLSSPSSEDDSSVTKTPVSRAEFLFDQIRHSTPSYASGVPVGAGLEDSKERTEEFGGNISALRKEVFSSDRKRAAPDSGYLSDLSFKKKRAEPHPEGAGSPSEGEGPNSPVTASLLLPAHLLMSQSSPEGAEPPGEEEGSPVEREGSPVEGAEPVKEPGAEPQMTSGITAAFNTFKSHLEQHFTGCWQNVETEILLSLKKCQQQVSALVTAISQHRLVLMQRFETSVSDQLNQLHENSSNLNAINTQMLSFFSV